MKLTRQKDGNNLYITLEGRLDTLTAPDFQKEMVDLNEISNVTVDCSNLEYVSSAGLRMFLHVFKSMKVGGTMTLTNTNDVVKEVFKVTGLNEIITVQ